jgi:hypothetical protein|tara:strand:+ start:190 stop:414 length:225 start_codon:yes stop_codon:yes gene_type:complete
MAVKPKKAAPKKTRKRAHKKDGSFKADDPSTPDINEAFESQDQDAEQKRREAQRAKFAPPAPSSGTRYLGGKLV